MTISIIVPAHNEESVIARCLQALADGGSPDELELIVVCNGCTDATSERAQSAAPSARVIEVPVASKTMALNAGDRAATFFPRLYVDADVVLHLQSARRLAATLRHGTTLAAAPQMEMDLSEASWFVRAYYAVWRTLPYTREGMMGVGVYGLSEEGRRRFDDFPDVIADDGYIRMLFQRNERALVRDAFSRVTAPTTVANLVRIKSRSRLGGYQLAAQFPDLAAREQGEKRYGRAVASVLFRPWLWPHAVVYFAVNVAARNRARRQWKAGLITVWERDTSSRRRAST